MVESVERFGPSGKLAGILTRPDSRPPKGPAFLILNAGILHRVGPNRLHVNLARALAQAGFMAFRFDFMGYGDSIDQGLDRAGASLTRDTKSALDHLAEKHGLKHFVLLGICTGAQVALEAAVRDLRVDGLVLMEGPQFKRARYYWAPFFSTRFWKKIVSGESHTVRKVRQKLTGNSPAKKSTKASGRELDLLHVLDTDNQGSPKEKFELLRARGAELLLVYGENNFIRYNYRLRKSDGKWRARGMPPNVNVEFIEYADHTFSLLQSQRNLTSVLLEWSERFGKG